MFPAADRKARTADIERPSERPHHDAARRRGFLCRTISTGTDVTPQARREVQHRFGVDLPD
jgi:hypothetical protein